MVERKKSLPAGLMLVTDRNRSRLPLEEAVREALAGGVRVVQLREKDLSSRELFRWGERLLPLCRERGALFLINGRVEVALAVGADGVHLPADGLPPREVRRRWPELIIGISVHGEEEAARAEGADYLLAGHIFATVSKPGLAPRGLDFLRRLTAVSFLPVLAIGGITPDNAREVREAGAAGIAVMGAILEAEDPREAAASLVRAWHQADDA